jgi:hypothetical protein
MAQVEHSNYLLGLAGYCLPDNWEPEDFIASCERLGLEPVLPTKLHFIRAKKCMSAIEEIRWRQALPPGKLFKILPAAIAAEEMHRRTAVNRSLGIKVPKWKQVYAKNKALERREASRKRMNDLMAAACNKDV